MPAAGFTFNPARPMTSHSLNVKRTSWWRVIRHPGFRGGARLIDLSHRNDLAFSGTTPPAYRGVEIAGSDGSLLYDGSTSEASTASVKQALAATQQATFSAWCNFTSIAAGIPVIASRPSTNFLGMLLSGNIAAGFPLTGVWTNTASEYNANTGLLVTAGEWTFCAVTVNGTTITVYRWSPTRAMASATITITATNEDMTQTWYTGIDSGSAAKFAGRKDSISIWSGRALSASEISALLFEELSGCPNTISWLNASPSVLIAAAAPAARQQTLMLLGCGA